MQWVSHNRTLKHTILSVCPGIKCIHLQGYVSSVTAVLFSGRPSGKHSQKQILDLILLHRELIMINKAEGAEQLESIMYARS